MGDWSAKQYLRFEKERSRPARDLVSQISPESVGRVLDAGCGPGNSTALLLERFPGREVIGADSSENMLEAARKALPGVTFMQADLQGDISCLGGDYDLVFSNACLQWVPDHRRLLPRLVALLRPGGALAVQIPMQQKLPIHRIIQEVAQLEPFAPYDPQRLYHNLKPGEYYDLLTELDGDCDMWQTTYCHVLSGHQDILEWYRGSGLRPYLDALPEELRAGFEGEVMARLQESYPLQADGKVLFDFPRFFFVARF